MLAVVTGAMIIGVGCGLGAAVMQSISYIASRHFTNSKTTYRGADQSVRLLVLMHLWMGVMAAVVLPFVWTTDIQWHLIAMPVFATVIFSVLGQTAQTVAIRLAEPSRVSPLLTAKVVFPAILTAIVGQPVGRIADSSMTSWQWLAVGLCVLAGILISYSGGTMRPAALLAVLAACFAFAGGDWCVGLTVGGILRTATIMPLQGSLLAASFLYLLTAMLGIAALFTHWGRPAEGRVVYPWRDWRDSFPYAASWFLAMILLFVSFGEIGVVLGTILQCTRAFITIVLGAGLMYLGYAHIEAKQPRRVVMMRVAAGVLMSAAISLYIARSPSALWEYARHGGGERGRAEAGAVREGR